MTMIRRAITATVWTLAALSLGCASSPSHFYTLNPTSAVTPASGAASSTLIIIVGSVTIPAIVDMPQIVVSTGANQVSADQFHLWASPLRNNIALVVCANLAALLGTPNVSSILRVDADYRVEIDVQIFQSAPGDAAILSAIWTVRRVKDGKTQTGRTQVREPSLEKSYQALAAAHSRALNQLSLEIADEIRVLDHAIQ
jgi:uncharacterized lipoprotein YmbA